MELTVVVSILFVSVRQEIGSRNWSPQKKEVLGGFLVLGKETCFFPSSPSISLYYTAAAAAAAASYQL